ncbi:hypothetical protein [Longimicrobium sp.]|jgi:hypothetical protein|uniref:hypothetical protein n=1 Tax=Longimicrobium sp. TaxID=2029185 RepID=UPI002F920A7C
MDAQIIDKDPVEILNYCAKYLARGDRFTDSSTPNQSLTRVSEPWRFPIVETYGEPGSIADIYEGQNTVTLVYVAQDDPRAQVSVIGTFGKLTEPIPMPPVQFLGEPTPYRAVTLVLPVERRYRYRFVVDGQSVLDPVNPQRLTLPNGRTWSTFFTDYYTPPTSFETWELRLLYRLSSHILPFRTQDSETFLNQFYNGLNPTQKNGMRVYEMDVSVGSVNYIDNVVAREESHHLIDYKICLELIDQVLRQRNPYVESWEVSEQLITQLYDEMAGNQVAGWDTSRYGNPFYFLQVLRRHTITGVFSHPRYGGNLAGFGWVYLQDRYRDPDGNTLFDWSAALEPPLGVNVDYHA